MVGLSVSEILMFIVGILTVISVIVFCLAIVLDTKKGPVIGISFSVGVLGLIAITINTLILL